MRFTWMLFCIGILWKSCKATECPSCRHAALRSENVPENVIFGLVLSYQRNDFECAENRITPKRVCGINETCWTHYSYFTASKHRRFPDAKVEVEIVFRGCGSPTATDCRPLEPIFNISYPWFANGSFSGYECTTAAPRMIDLKIHEDGFITLANTDSMTAVCSECLHTAYRFVNWPEDNRPQLAHYYTQNNFDCAENRHPLVNCPHSVPCVNTHHLYEARGMSNLSDALLQVETVYRTCDPDGKQGAMDLGCKTTFNASPNDEIGYDLFLSNFTEANSTLVSCNNKGPTDFQLKIHADTKTSGPNGDAHTSGACLITNNVLVVAFANIFGYALC